MNGNLGRYEKTNIFDVNTAQVVNGYFLPSGAFTPYATNAMVFIPIQQGKVYDIYGIVRVSSSTAIKYGTFANIPSTTETDSIRYGSFAQSETLTITADTNENYIAVMFCGDGDYSAYGSVQNALNINCANMKVDTLQWQDIPYRRYETATETIQSGDTIYANGQPISTYTIKGNTVQSGTPTPSAPLSVNGVGNKTANLLSGWTKGQRLDPSTGVARTDIAEACTTDYIAVDKTKTYIAKPLYLNYSSFVAAYNASKQFLGRTSATQRSSVTFDSTSFTSGTPQGTGDIAYIRITIYNAGSQTGDIDDAIAMETMMNEGNTVLPYEPYGYKIPISTLQTVNNYLGSVQSTRQIGKYEITGTETVEIINNRAFRFGTIQNYLRQLNADILVCSHYDSFPNISGVNDITSDNVVTFLVSSSGNNYMYIRDDSFSGNIENYKTWLQTQYAAGTPVTVWYVLQTATTGIVNEPLMKIGTYADSISNAAAIPTTEGANTITVDTTVQPSEFTATWTGWHDSSVKEYDGTDWQ